MGSKLGTIFARAGHDVTFSYSHDRKKLERLARRAGGEAGTPDEAARGADAVLLAVHWSRVDDVLRTGGQSVAQIGAELLLAYEQGRHAPGRRL